MRLNRACQITPDVRDVGCTSVRVHSLQRGVVTLCAMNRREHVPQNSRLSWPRQPTAFQDFVHENFALLPTAQRHSVIAPTLLRIVV
jgi:hypothetical protein